VWKTPSALRFFQTLRHGKVFFNADLLSAALKIKGAPKPFGL
jgi:hypothetical protein